MASLKKLCDILKENYKEFLIMSGISFLLYIPMISNELTNTYDGMWWGDYGFAGAWELSIGRWLWFYLDYFRRGVCAEPGISLVSLLSINFGILILMELIGLKDKKTRFLSWLFLSCNTTVCIYLSFRYMSPTFTFSWLFSILGVYFLRQFNSDNVDFIIDQLLGIVCIACSLGLYQANIGCTLFALSMLTIFIITNNTAATLTNILKKYVFNLMEVAISCILYYLIWTAHLHLLHVDKATYKGTSDVSILNMLKSLPLTIRQAYLSFFQYFATGQHNNIYQNYYLLEVIILIFVVLSIMKLLFLKISLNKRLFLIVFFVLLPVMCNVCLILAPESGGMQLQMTMPIAMFVPLDFIFLIPKYWKKSAVSNVFNKGFKWYTATMYLAFSFVLFGNIMQISIDQHEMFQCRNTSIGLMNQIIANVEFTKKLNIKSDTQFVFVGIPTENYLYQKDAVYYYANEYSHYGAFYTTGPGLPLSYAGYMRDCGLNIPIVQDTEEYHKILDSIEVQEMPAYPAEGYAKMIDGYCVVKIS